MKRFYMTLALAGSFAFGAQAQNVDVAAITSIEPGTSLCDGWFFSPTQTPTGDSVYGIYGVEFRGPDGVIVDDKVTFRSSFSNFLTQAEADEQGVPFEDRYAWYSILTLTQQSVDNSGIFYSFDSIGGIGMLIDWDRYEQYGIDSVRIYGPPHENFVNGQEYGFFTRSWGMGENANAIVNTDDSMQNNWSVVRIVWNDCNGTSVKDLFAPKDKMSLNVYPNPADNEVNFNFNFAKNTNVQIYVRDITGRVVSSKNVGHVTAGERSFKMDVATLPAGMYSIEMSSGTISATAKFSKR